MSKTCPNCSLENPNTQKFCGDCGTHLGLGDDARATFTKTLETPVGRLARGSVFAERYEIIEELGVGGMGRVYRVHDTRVNEEAALKLINPEISADPKVLERFNNELRIARKITHRAVCRMHDLGEYEGTHYITMEYVAGEDLKSLISRIGQMPTGKALDIGRQICAGLSEAHRLGIVHRDLKPGNIMIDKQGNAKIMDFGIARSTETAKVTGTGVIIGTPEYMSPEQAEAEDIDPRSDIYSLGIILYEMVTGQVPFTGKSGLSVAMKQKGELPKDPQEINPQVPDELSSLILKCLEKEREQRYETSEALKQKLDELARLLPSTRTKISRKKAHASREVTVTISPRRLLLPLTIALVLTLIALFLWKPWAPSRLVSIPEGRPSLAILPFTNNTTEPELDKFRTVLADALEHHLSQSKYLHVIPKERLLTVFQRMGLEDKNDFSSDDIEKLIAHGIGNHILTAQYFKSRDAFRINYTIRDVRLDKALYHDSKEGQGEESLLQLVDAMSSSIKIYLKIEETESSSVIDKAYGVIPTNSLEAFRYYSEGTSLYYLGKENEALPLFEKAIEIDPEMALAYRQIGAHYSNIGNEQRAREYIEKALQFADRIPERHQLIIQATYEWRFGGVEGKKKTMELATKLLQDYPDDLIGNRLLQLTCRDLGEIDKSIEYGEHTVALWPENIINRGNLANVYKINLMFDKSTDVFKEALNLGLDKRLFLGTLIWSCLYSGDLDYAMDLLNDSSSEIPAHFKYQFQGWISQLRGDLIRAENEYKQLAQEINPIYHEDGKIFIALLKIERGKFQEAEVIFRDMALRAEQRGDVSYQFGSLIDLAHINQILNKPNLALEKSDEAFFLVKDGRNVLQKTLALIQKGKALIALDRVDEAKICGDELATIVESSIFRGGKTGWYRHLLGLIALNEGNYDKAIELFINSTPNWAIFPKFIPSAYLMMIEPLAKAYFDKGDYEKALEKYEEINSSHLLRIGHGDIYVHSFYMLGQIYAELGRNEEAQANYQKFIDLWKDCDPEIRPMVEDAHIRLARLQPN